MITLYSRATCAPCHTIKYWLQKKGYSFTEVTAPDSMLTPTVIIGEQTLTLPTIPVLVRLLEAQNTAQIS